MTANAKTFSKAIIEYANMVRNEGKFNAYRKYMNAADKVVEYQDTAVIAVTQRYIFKS